MSIAPGVRLGPYVVEAPIGAGGMGEVYRARDSRLDRLVAVKVLPQELTASPHALERFEREARAVAALTHPNICTIHDVGEAPGSHSATEDRRSSIHFLVMELLDGETLQRRLLRGALDLAQLIEYAIAMADALDTAHVRGIIHRDLKPANVFLAAHGPKILDFGLAKAVPAEAPAGASHEPTLPAAALLTSPGSTVGTVAYMSPEQLRGDHVDARTDLFSLGLVIYEMATGAQAFTGATSAVVSAAILHEQPVAPRALRPALPARLEEVILKALEKDRDFRCQTASELRADLKRLKRELESDPHRSTSRTPVSPDPTAVRSGSTEVQPRSDSTKPSSSSPAGQGAPWFQRRGRLAVAATALALVAGGAYLLVQFLQERAQPASRSSTAPLESLEIEQLTTSGNAARPAISPDGNFVAYIQQDDKGSSLWIRQTVSASNVQTVPPQVGVALLGAAVTPDGGFVDFVRQESGRWSLWRVAFLGGRPRRLIDNLSSLPGWSPDGREMAFVRADQPRSSALIIADADGGQERVLVELKSPGPRFMSFGLPSDPGIPPAWSPSGDVIGMALYDDRGGLLTGHVGFVSVADGSQRMVPLGQPATTGLAWTDDSSLVASRPGEPGAPSQLWRVSYPDGEVSRISNDLSSYTGVSTTSDRRSLVTVRTDGRVSVWAGDDPASGTDLVPAAPFVATTGFGYGLTWAADRLVHTTRSGSRPSISVLAPGGTQSEEIVPRGVWPAATSDGRTIVYTSMDPASNGNLWKIDADGRRAVQLASGNSISPMVTRDDRSVVFISPPLSGGTLSPWIVSLAGGPPTPLAKDHVMPGTLDPSPDGKSVVFVSLGEPARIVICELPTCSARRSLPLPPNLSRPLRWMPSGREVAYVVAGNLWSVPTTGGASPRQLTHFTDNRTIEAFAWSNDGKRLAIARTTVINDIVWFKGLRK
jgi:serine/threonine protein kinase